MGTIAADGNKEELATLHCPSVSVAISRSAPNRYHVGSIELRAKRKDGINVRGVNLIDIRESGWPNADHLISDP
jgi:hypothetical protein